MTGDRAQCFCANFFVLATLSVLYPFQPSTLDDDDDDGDDGDDNEDDDNVK